jgi:hypothetical protein
MQLSPNGILYDTDQDIIVKRVFKTEDLPKTLEVAKNWSSKLDVRDEERQTVRVALYAVTDSDAAEVSWSRHAMQTFYALDEAIQRIWKTDNWKSMSISILYAIDEDFRTKVRTSLEKIKEEQYQAIEFDTTNTSNSPTGNTYHKATTSISTFPTPSQESTSLTASFPSPLPT